MPRWILNRPSKSCSRHEQKVADFLRKLSSRWTVRWGFYYRDDNGVQREGDFLILGPEGGLLVLEVKGKPIRHFPETGRWEGGDDKDHPMFQLDQEWKAVLLEMEAAGGRLPTVKKALCLPKEFVRPEQPEHAGISRDMIFGSNDLVSFQQAWSRCFGGDLKPVTDAERQTFLKTFGKGGRRDDIGAFVGRTEELFREQFTASYGVLDLVAGNRQLLVEGRSGSGKTWHAVEKAVQLAEGGGGRDVLLLCYNLALGKLLKELVARRALERGSITALQWEELSQKVLEDCGMSYDPPVADAPRDERLKFYDEQLPGLLLECVRDPELAAKLPKFGALVVDEAQDHDTAFADALGESDPNLCGWWSIYWSLLSEGTNSPMALFYDPPQRPPFREQAKFDPEKLMSHLSQPAHIRLPRALRYTRPVFEFLRSLDAAGTAGLIAEMGHPEDLPEEPEVEVYACPDEADAVREGVEAILEDWDRRGACAPSDVLILHLKSDLERSRLGGCEILAGHRLVDYLAHGASADGGKVVAHTSINKAKGLDATGVIMVGMRPFLEIAEPGYQHAYFMGASRAKQLLAVVHC